MLSPDDLSRAGEAVAAAYREVEDAMLDALVGLLVDGDVASQRFETAMALLSQAAAPRVREVMERHRGRIGAAAASEVARWLARSDSDDLARVRAALGVELPGITSREAAHVVEGVAGILSRDNLAMEAAARESFLRHATWAIAQVSSGAMTAHRATREAAVRMAGEGIPIVTYRDAATGRVTVSNHADVAARRHVRTQLSQATMARTLRVCAQAGIGFVEVSSHAGARPSHAEWHGRVYSLHGDRTVGGVRYPDFYRGTGYGGTGPYAALGDRLGGVNCRHTFGPWLPGTPRAYGPDPEHPSGLPSDEVYRLTQRQRAGERAIRRTKRELVAARRAAGPGDPADAAEVVRLQDRLKAQQAAMRKLVADANARGKARVLTRSYAAESVPGYRREPQPSIRGKHTLKDGRTAYSQAEIDAAVEKFMPNVNLPVKPRYVPNLRDYGQTIGTERIPGYPGGGYRIKAIKIGPQRDGTERELADTLLHEALEAKLMMRGDRRLAAGDAAVHPHIDKVIARYARMKGLW